MAVPRVPFGRAPPRPRQLFSLPPSSRFKLRTGVGPFHARKAEEEETPPESWTRAAERRGGRRCRAGFPRPRNAKAPFFYLFPHFPARSLSFLPLTMAAGKRS